MTVDIAFYSLLFKQKVAAVPSYFHTFFVIAFLEEAVIGNVIIILRINFIIIMYINNNVKNTVISDNFFKIPRPYFAF